MKKSMVSYPHSTERPYSNATPYRYTDKSAQARDKFYKATAEDSGQRSVTDYTHRFS